MQLTQEQQAVMDHKEGILLVPAGAGCGKTFMGLEYVEELNSISGLYTAFNKAIVEESREKFHNTNVEVQNITCTSS